MLKIRSEDILHASKGHSNTIFFFLFTLLIWGASSFVNIFLLLLLKLLELVELRVLLNLSDIKLVIKDKKKKNLLSA